ncbi:zinc-dependent alcohol dehydrogenase [Geminisphaera colitermitum]|uniref:zinc-dependent alcohol dehydrogenase n=1 Tax=Geminisphaera colitermitum TaxID=1148786 RepID=UPI000158C57E|nr:zinc-binding alcohol dehydrogenase [Geminisphaera colitermitum]
MHPTKRKAVLFTSIGTAKLTDIDHRELNDDMVLVKNEVSAISAGTERAGLMDLPNLGDQRTPTGKFPRLLGYSGVGIVEKVGEKVGSIQVGDRVLTHWGSCHSNYNYVTEANLLKIDNKGLASEHAVFAVIAGFSLNGLRKTRLEIGESAAVVGMGILGAFALALCRIAGGAPVIAADLSEQRRALALSLGAHHAFNPADKDYIKNVKDASRGGVNAVIEVTGLSAALKQALGFTAKFGRVALLGCTRVAENDIDFYQDVHRPGIELIGAHTDARAKQESRPHAWTWKDDARALMDFMADGRLDMSKFLSAVYSPHEGAAVYERLAKTPADFPVGAVFDWRKL